MARKTITIDPVTRIEGHLKIEVDIDNGMVSDARCGGTLWRGIEIILQGRDPRDAQHITQRICGVCPIAHATASAFALDNAFGVTPPENGRLIRNLIFGANFLQSHLLHFYHLAALDYVTGPELAPFIPRYEGDYRLPKKINDKVAGHYIQALDYRKKAHELLAIWGGKAPMVMAITPGGVTEKPTAEKITASLARIRELKDFVETVYIPDVQALAKAYGDYKKIGAGCGNFLSYGAFPSNGANETLFKRGRIRAGKFYGLDTDKISEDVTYSWYADESGRRHPKQGMTVPAPEKPEAYSWIKAPRYENAPYEVGPLARLRVNNEYRGGVSVMDRHAARAREALKIAAAMEQWVVRLEPEQPVFTPFEIPAQSEGMGLTEAPRGALGHWIRIENRKISHYQCVVPTTWNCSPRDNEGRRGPAEEALMGTPVKDADNPIEIVRVVRSFDPCLACAVHIIRPRGRIKQFRIV